MDNRRSMWRRALLSLIAAIALATATFAPAIASRSGAHPGAAPHRATQATCAKANKPSGTIKYSDWEFPDTLNYYQTGASVSLETVNIMIEALGLLNPKGHLLMDVLQSVKASNGGRIFTATVRKGLRWSDGQPLTSADIKFAWQIIKDPLSGPYAPSIGADHISRVDTPNKYTAVFHMSSPFAPFTLQTLPGFYPWPVSWPGAWAKGDVKAAAKELFQDQKFNFEGPNFPTNGPYQVTTGGFVQNDRIVLQPMKYYRTLSCGARIAKPIFVFYSDKPGLIAAAASKGTDLTQDYTPADLKELDSHASAFKTAPTPAFEVEHLTLNNDATVSGQKNPLHDARVRVALALALNKMNLIQSALQVSKSVASQFIAWSPLIVTPKLTQPYADTNIRGQWDPLQKKYVANTGTGKALADAKKLLAQAGYPNGFTVQGLTTAGNPTRVAEFASMAHDWTKIGVKFVPNYIPASKLFANSWDAGNPVRLGTYQIAMWTDVASPDPNYYINVFQSKYIDREKTVHSPVNANVGGIHNKLIDEAFNKGATTLNKKQREHWYQIWQEQVNKNAYWITLYYRTDISTTDGRLGNYIPNGTGEGFSWNAFAWYDKGLK